MLQDQAPVVPCYHATPNWHRIRSSGVGVLIYQLHSKVEYYQHSSGKHPRKLLTLKKLNNPFPSQKLHGNHNLIATLDNCINAAELENWLPSLERSKILPRQVSLTCHQEFAVNLLRKQKKRYLFKTCTHIRKTKLCGGFSLLFVSTFARYIVNWGNQRRQTIKFVSATTSSLHVFEGFWVNPTQANLLNLYKPLLSSTSKRLGNLSCPFDIRLKPGQQTLIL